MQSTDAYPPWHLLSTYLAVHDLEQEKAYRNIVGVDFLDTNLAGFDKAHQSCFGIWIKLKIFYLILQVN